MEKYKFTEGCNWVLTLRKCSSNSFLQVPAYIFGDSQDTQFIPSRHSKWDAIFFNPRFAHFSTSPAKICVSRMCYRCLWQVSMFIRASAVAPFYCSVRKLFPFIIIGVFSFLSRNPSNTQRAFWCVMLVPKHKVLPDLFPMFNLYAPLPIFY